MEASFLVDQVYWWRTGLEEAQAESDEDGEYPESE